MAPRLPVYRSRLLATPRLGSAMGTAIEVDTLRRRDNLELETVLQRYRAQLGPAADAPDTVGARLDAIEAALGLAAPIALFVGGATSSVNVTQIDAENVTVVGVSGSGIDFAFGETPAPNANYQLIYTDQTLTQAVQHILLNKTRTGFRVAFRRADGTTSNPLIDSWGFGFTVMAKGVFQT